MENLTYKLEVFEGPMDLLLHLISKHKLNINDIPIVELVNQYLDYVRQMEDADFDIAGDFLEMAARLIYIKTVSLLPRHEEAETLKKELTGELIEYRDCKLMAEKLSHQTKGFDRYVREPQGGWVNYDYERFREGEELLDAYISVAGKAMLPQRCAPLCANCGAAKKSNSLICLTARSQKVILLQHSLPCLSLRKQSALQLTETCKIRLFK